LSRLPLSLLGSAATHLLCPPRQHAFAQKALAARLMQSLFRGSEEEFAAKTVYVLSPEDRIAVSFSELQAQTAGAKTI
jgi:hypothetical protein